MGIAGIYLFFVMLLLNINLFFANEKMFLICTDNSTLGRSEFNINLALKLYLGAISVDYLNNNQSRRYGHIEMVMEDLKNENWEDDETLCRDLLIKVMKNVQNSTIWATWIWDSMQSPVGHLYGSRNNYGNYDECMEFPWEKVDFNMRTQYCLTRINLSDADTESNQVDLFGSVKTYIRRRTKYHLKFNMLNWGVCTPVACKPHSVAKFVSVMFRQTHLGLAVDKPNITVEYCDVAGVKKYELDFGFFFSILFMAFVVVGILLATCIVHYKKTDKNIGFLKAFDISTNGQALVTIADNEIKSLFGIRVISCIILVGLHVWLGNRTNGVINALSLNKQFDILSVIYPLEMTVDTFLFMSGLLLVKTIPKNDVFIFKPLKMTVKRYIRTAGSLGIALLVYINVLKNISRGPAAKEFYDQNIHACYKNWWSTLLLIHNYVNPANMCHVITWSAAVDFHLSMIGTLICWVFLKNKRTGIMIFIMGFISSILAPAIFVYDRGEMLLNLDFRFTDDYNNYGMANGLHTSSHLRAGAYFVGMAVGYIKYKYDPINHRNIISKKYSILGFCVFLVIFSGIFVMSFLMVKNGYTITQAILYASLKRIVWAVLIGILILICEYGQLPLVTGFLSWSAWVPIAKLSFGIFMVHGIFIAYSAGISQTPRQYDIIGLLTDTLGVSVLSTLISLPMWLFIEAPMYNIIALVFRTRKNNENHEDMKGVNDKQISGSERINKKTL